MQVGVVDLRESGADNTGHPDEARGDTPGWEDIETELGC
jgi:hypothetical protein